MDRKVLALKRVAIETGRDSDDNHSAQSTLGSYANEIALLRKLRGNSAIIALEDAEVDAARGIIHVVMEIGEIDLNQLLLQLSQKKEDPTGTPRPSRVTGSGLSPHFVKLTWQQMLEAVLAMHSQRVVHGDLKPANFVFCRGVLKLIDFGIAKAIGNDTANIHRDSQVGTLNYMCPEALLDTGKGETDPRTGQKASLMKLGTPSDVW